jgi:hypothetical protein
MFVVFYTVNLYICLFMTCSTSYCLYDKLMDQWNVCIYINSITYAITLPSSSVFTLFRLLPHIAIGFVLDVDIFVVCF